MRLWTTWSTAISVHIWNVNNVAKYLKKSIMIKMSQKSRLRATFNRQFYRSCGIRNASYVMMPRLINCTNRQAFLREKSTSDVTFASFEQWFQLKRHSRSLANWCIIWSLVSYIAVRRRVADKNFASLHTATSIWRKELTNTILALCFWKTSPSTSIVYEETVKWKA